MARVESEVPGTLFSGALCETVASMAGIGLEPIDNPTFNKTKFECQQITAVMALIGSKNGFLTINADRDSAAELVMYMTGIEKSALAESDLCDGIMELVNMVAGGVRVKLKDSEYAFQMSSPWAMVGDNIHIVTKRRLDSFSACLGAGTINLKLKVIYV